MKILITAFDPFGGETINPARIQDNAGNQPIDSKIYDDGESAYFSTLPKIKLDLIL